MKSSPKTKDPQNAPQKMAETKQRMNPWQLQGVHWCLFQVRMNRNLVPYGT